MYWSCIIQLHKIYLYFSSFCVDSLNFSMLANMSSANKDSFTSAFLIHIPRSFTCCIAMARTSRTMLNKNVDSIYSSFFLIFLGQSISSFTFVVVLKYSHNFFYTPPLREWSLSPSPWMGAVVSDLLLMNRFWWKGLWLPKDQVINGIVASFLLSVFLGYLPWEKPFVKPWKHTRRLRKRSIRWGPKASIK